MLTCILLPIKLTFIKRLKNILRSGRLPTWGKAYGDTDSMVLSNTEDFTECCTDSAKSLLGLS